MTCWVRFVRSSTMVRSTPSTSSAGFRAFCTRRIVAISSEIPSRAKYSHWSGHEHALRGGEGVDGQQAQARRAVDEDVVEPGGHGRQGLLQPELSGQEGHELHLGSGQVAVGGGEGQVLEVGLEQDLLEGPLVDEDVVEAGPRPPGPCGRGPRSGCPGGRRPRPGPAAPRRPGSRRG